MLKRIIDLPNHSFFLFGPRQVGKSTLIQEYYDKKESLYYNLLKIDEYLRLKENPIIFREETLSSTNIETVIIDEIQRIPELLDEIHYLIESQKINKKFILLGSSARKLKRSKANLLGGRLITRYLFPLTHFELSDDFNLMKALKYGTLPKIYLEQDENLIIDYLKSYVDTYLKEEIEAEALIRDTGPFLRFLFQAGHENGNILNYSNISRDTGTSYMTIKEYYKILEDTLIGSFLFPFLKSKRKRIKLHPKFYFFDTGIARAITRRLSLNVEPKTPDFGNLFEQWVINETMRLNCYLKKDLEITYYRTEKGAEVDLVIETPQNKIIAVEIKSSENPYPQDYESGFRSLSLDIKLAKKICVCLAPRLRTENDVSIMPWQEFFKWLRDEI